MADLPFGILGPVGAQSGGGILTGGGMARGPRETRRPSILDGMLSNLFAPAGPNNAMSTRMLENMFSTGRDNITPTTGLGEAFEARQVMQARQKEMEAFDKEQQQAEQEQAALRQAFEQKAPDLLPWLDAGQVDYAMAEYDRRNQPQGGIDPTAAMQEYNFAVGQGYDGTFADWKNGGSNGGGGLGTTIYTLRGANGELIPAQVSQDGSLVPTRLPDNMSFDPGALNAERAAGNVTGKGAGQAALDLPAAITEAQKVALQIEDLKNHPGLDEIFGKTLGVIPNQWGPTFPGTNKANAMARIEQMSGNAFLNGRQLLKGGGAITDMESNKAEAAFARLSTAQTKEEFIKGLNEFNDALMTGVAKLQAQAGGTVQSNNFSGQTGGTTSSGLQFEILD